jgi:hypothetical protein
MLFHFTPEWMYYSRVGGTDTLSTSLSYFFWELSRQPDIMKKLQAELDEAMVDPRVIPDISVLQRLPYLNAFIKEGKCLYSSSLVDFWSSLISTHLLVPSSCSGPS